MVSNPRSVALAWLGGYLFASGVVLSLGGHGALAVVHALVLAVAAWTVHSKSDAAIFAGDLIPLFVTPILYAEIPFLIAALGSTYHDALIQGWELAVFGTQPSRSFAGAMPFALFSELLHAGYLAYYPVIFAPSLLLLLRNERRGVNETVLALTITYTVCFAIFAFMPVEGPRYLWAAPDHVPAGSWRSLATRILAAGSSRGAAFPSAHMAVCVTQAFMAWRWQPRAALPLAVIAILVGLGAVYGGFHYALDVIAGAALGAVVAVAVIKSSTAATTASTEIPSMQSSR
ncbi:MAG TPA: phosphatase PAP2 family protein [Gemmatimonadaceae bacterium]|nr:phosphatase PAP2 family protein [Gemmatimonadaceae bacterium]